MELEYIYGEVRDYNLNAENMVVAAYVAKMIDTNKWTNERNYFDNAKGNVTDEMDRGSRKCLKKIENWNILVDAKESRRMCFSRSLLYQVQYIPYYNHSFRICIFIQNFG